MSTEQLFSIDVLKLKNKYGIKIGDITNLRLQRINMALVPDDCLIPVAEDEPFERLPIDEELIVNRMLG